MAVLSRDGTSIVYDDAGQGNPPFVFVHDWLGDRNTWMAQVRDLSQSHRCVTFDLRGGGESGSHDVSSHADDIVALIQHLELPRPIVVGHGYGGLVALVVNQHHPDAISGIAMADPWLTVVASGELGEIATKVRESGDVTPARGFVDGFFGAATPADLRKRIQERLAGLSADAVAELFESAAALRPELDQLLKDADAKPFMALWASMPMGNPDELRNTTVFLRQEPIPGGSHYFPVEHPTITSALLRAFVDDVERDPRLNRQD